MFLIKNKIEFLFCFYWKYDIIYSTNIFEVFYERNKN